LNRTVLLWLAAGWVGFAALPWYAIEEGFWAFEWVLDGYPLDSYSAPALVQVFLGKPWLAPLALCLLAPLGVAGRAKADPRFASVLLAAGGGGLAYFFLQAFAIGIGGWEFGLLEAAFGPLGTRQFGMGYGALLVCGALLFLFTQGLAARGLVKGDVFVVGAIGLIIALVGAFIFFPVLNIMTSALQDEEGAYSVSVFLGKLFDGKIWSLRCLGESVQCGVAWNSLLLAGIPALWQQFFVGLFLILAVLLEQIRNRRGK